MKRFVATAFAAALALPLSANQTDTDFLDGMTLHHRHGIEMAQMAVRKAESADLRRLAQKMVDDQQKDIADFERMREGSVAEQRPELADMPGMSGMNMRWLEAKDGREFDRAFAIAMIDHHLGGIRMANHETAQGGRAPVKSKAREIARKQRGEVRDLARHK